MGLFLLVLFVGASLALTLRAWTGSDGDPYRAPEAGSREAANEQQTALVVAVAAVTFLSSFLSEVLRHSFKLSFLKAGVISLGILVTGQWLAFRLLRRRPAKT